MLVTDKNKKGNKMNYIDTPINKPSTLSVKQEVKLSREKNINNMPSSAIIWHLIKRHKVSLLWFTVIVLASGNFIQWWVK